LVLYIEKRYKALRTIGTIYKILGIVVGILTIFSVLGFCVISVLGGAALGSLANDPVMSDIPALPGIFSGMVGGIIATIIGIIYGGGMSVTLYAFGEFIYLFLAIEENTRLTNSMLQQGSKS
jgi:hypothetical protein